MFVLTSLLKDQISEFSKKLPQSIRQRLAAESDLSSAVGIGVTIGGDPVGLAFTRPRCGHVGVAEVQCLWVNPQHKALGLDVHILTELLAKLRSEGYSRCDLFYDPTHRSASSLEMVLTQSEWSKPEPDAYTVESDHQELSKAPWMRLKLADNFSVFPWAELTGQERATIVKGKTDGWFPAALDPFLIDTNHTALAPGSFGLRLNGSLVGWVINVFGSTETICCKTLFVDPPLQKLGKSIALLADSIRHTQGYRYFWDVSFDRADMRRFVEKRMKPYVSSIRTIYRSSKVIQNQTALCA